MFSAGLKLNPNAQQPQDLSGLPALVVSLSNYDATADLILMFQRFLVGTGNYRNEENR
jgi:hypothetical protein